MKLDLKHGCGMLLCGAGLLLASCTAFRAREIDLDKRSRQESNSYYRFSAGGGDQLSFQSQNFLSSNLLMNDFHNDGEKLVRRLAIRQELVSDWIHHFIVEIKLPVKNCILKSCGTSALIFLISSEKSCAR